MNGQHNMHHPIQHESYNFPDISTASDRQVDPHQFGQLISSLVCPCATASSPLCPPAHSGTTHPPGNMTLSGTKPRLNKTGITLHIKGMKEQIGLLESDNELLKNTINKLETEARKEKTCVGQEFIALRETIMDLQQQIHENADKMDDDDEGDESDTGAKSLDEETSEAVEKSYIALSNNVFLVSLGIL